MSNKKVTDYDYLFLSSALRAKETKMLTKDKLERMLDAPSFDDAAKILMDCGYEDMSGMNLSELEKALAAHRAEIFSELYPLIPEPSIVDAFRLKYDYHNAKVLIKAESADIDGAYLFSESGMVPIETIAEAYHSEDYSALPKKLGESLREARSVIKRTENSQLADFVLDKAYFDEMKEYAEKLYSPFLADYVKLSIDGVNLRTAVRTLRMGRDIDFLRNALIAGGNIEDELVAEAAYSEEGFAPLYGETPYKEAALLGADAAKGGRLTEFELSCDNVLIKFLEKAKYHNFGAQPVIAYIGALENEITAARMILSGKLSGVEPALIRERLRDINA
ncbi:MAG: V-type ATPase subunit [Clostridiales bacterium]|nr:V-type ATPase subunit [Clostridiales bacterium]